MKKKDVPLQQISNSYDAPYIAHTHNALLKLIHLAHLRNHCHDSQLLFYNNFLAVMRKNYEMKKKLQIDEISSVSYMKV